MKQRTDGKNVMTSRHNVHLKRPDSEKLELISCVYFWH